MLLRRRRKAQRICLGFRAIVEAIAMA